MLDESFSDDGEPIGGGQNMINNNDPNCLDAP